MPVTAVIGADNPDNVTIELDEYNRLRIKDGGVTTAKIAANAVSENVLLNVTGTASGEGSVTNAANATDGDASTYATFSNASTTGYTYLTWTFASPVDISYASMKVEGASSSYAPKLQYQDTDDTWVTIATHTSSDRTTVGGFINQAVKGIRIMAESTTTSAASFYLYEVVAIQLKR